MKHLISILILFFTILQTITGQPSWIAKLDTTYNFSFEANGKGDSITIVTGNECGSKSTYDFFFTTEVVPDAFRVTTIEGLEMQTPQIGPACDSAHFQCVWGYYYRDNGGIPSWNQDVPSNFPLSYASKKETAQLRVTTHGSTIGLKTLPNENPTEFSVRVQKVEALSEPFSPSIDTVIEYEDWDASSILEEAMLPFQWVDTSNCGITVNVILPRVYIAPCPGEVPDLSWIHGTDFAVQVLNGPEIKEGANTLEYTASSKGWHWTYTQDLITYSLTSEEIGYNSQTVCAGDSALFQCQYDTHWNTWFTPAGQEVMLPPGKYLAVVQAPDSGCETSIEIEVTQEPCGSGKVYIPNVFSPNGDGVNDEFYPLGKDIEVHSLLIVDRWGGVRHDSPLPWSPDSSTVEGVYVYLALIKSGTDLRQYQGSITLLR